MSRYPDNHAALLWLAENLGLVGVLLALMLIGPPRSLPSEE